MDTVAAISTPATPAITPVSGAPAWGAPVGGVTASTSGATQYVSVASEQPAANAGSSLLESAIRDRVSQQQMAAAVQAQQGVVPTLSMPVVNSAPVASATLPMSAPAVADEGAVKRALNGFAAATGAVVEQARDVAGSGAATARRVGSEVWAGIRSPKMAHVTQVPSKFNPSPAAGNKDCGPTSVVIALKLLGEKIPGVGSSASPQQLINRVRKLAGSPDNTQSTSNHELAKALEKAGTSTREISDMGDIRAAVRAGKPVILNGNPRHSGAYGHKFNADQMTPYNGAHWIVVSGMDDRTGKYIINDPLSKVGPVKVTAAQLDAYRGGSIGIEVSR